jgi:glucosamine-6-phosphate deaminase
VIGLTVVPDHEALIQRFAETLLDEYVVGKGAGRAKVVYIVPVGPVGQFQRFAALARERQVDSAT